jgi:hypothetical protein
MKRKSNGIESYQTETGKAPKWEGANGEGKKVATEGPRKVKSGVL